jgi:hypothetical protein
MEHCSFCKKLKPSIILLGNYSKKGGIMSKKMKISFVCYLLVALVSIGFGIVYFLSSQIMPYHQQVIGVKWSEVTPRFQMMFLAFLNSSGISMVCLGLAMLFLLFFPFKKGEIWSRLAIPLIYLPGGIWVLYIARNLHTKTQAATPWQFAAILVLITIVGAILSIKKSDDHSQ